MTPRVRVAVAAALLLTASSSPFVAPAGAAPVAGATVAVNGFTTVYNGGDADNALFVTTALDPMVDYNVRLVFHDRVDIRRGSGCFYPSASTHRVVACTVSLDDPFLNALQINLGAGDDAATASARAPLGLESGFIVTLHGNAGNDKLATYDKETEVVAYGDDGNDAITGSVRGQQSFGGPGDDSIAGYGGNDVIYGNSGRDRLYGGPGDDLVFGGPDGDVIFGEAGNDTLWGGGGADGISGGSGRNTITQ